jgi:GTPase
VVLDPADGAGVSRLDRHSEVMAKELRDDGRLGRTVPVDATNAERIRGKFLA